MKRLVSIASMVLLAVAATTSALFAQTTSARDDAIAKAAAAAAAASVPSTTPTDTAGGGKVVATDTAPSQPGMYTGVVSCANSGCHGSPAPVANSNVLQNEYDSWLHSSPGPTHVRAYEILYNNKSRIVAKNMKLKTPPYESKICLDCHSTNVPKELQAGKIELTDGVQCEACHGPAGGWRAQHVQAGWTHEDSVKNGMIDLRNIQERGRICLSCHLGDATKTVDHELIAAGHPILTFELDNFTESRLMPPHWKAVKDKTNPEKYGAETHGVKAWAVGQASTFREGLLHLSRQAKSEKWPEFASMQCAACHHNLRTGEWRQVRGYTDRAGLPPWSPARWAVLRNVVSEVAPEQREQLDRDVAELASMVASMRSPDKVAAKADSIAKSMNTLIAKTESTQWSEKRVRSLMSSIAADSDFYYRNDRQSAEQATYALVSLGAYLARDNQKLVRSGMMKTVDSLYKQLNTNTQPDEIDNAKFADTLKQLREQMH